MKESYPLLKKGNETSKETINEIIKLSQISVLLIFLRSNFMMFFKVWNEFRYRIEEKNKRIQTTNKMITANTVLFIMLPIVSNIIQLQGELSLSAL